MITLAETYQQEPSRVFIIAAPAFESAEAPFHGVARRVPFRVVGLRAPGPGRKDGLNATREDVAFIGPVGAQAGLRRVRPSFHQDPGLRAVVTLAARHMQAQGTQSMRQDMDPWG